MTQHDLKSFDVETMHAATSPSSPTIGRIAHIGAAHEIFVKVGGMAACAARLLANIDREELTQPNSLGREVLVLFQDGDRSKPIIIGVLEDRLESLMQMDIAPAKSSQPPQEVRVDGQRVVIEAQEEIELKCGKGSITIRSDGKIVVKGTNVVSHATGANRIRGGSVSLN